MQIVFHAPVGAHGGEADGVGRQGGDVEPGLGRGRAGLLDGAAHGDGEDARKTLPVEMALGEPGGVGGADRALLDPAVASFRRLLITRPVGRERGIAEEPPPNAWWRSPSASRARRARKRRHAILPGANGPVEQRISHALVNAASPNSSTPIPRKRGWRPGRPRHAPFVRATLVRRLDHPDSVAHYADREYATPITFLEISNSSENVQSFFGTYPNRAGRSISTSWNSRKSLYSGK